MNRHFEPIQFNFDRNWLTKIMPRRKLPAFRAAFAKIADSYQDIAELKYDDHVQIDPEQAKAEYELDLHKARVMCHNIFWLRDCAASLDLADLCLVVAHEMYPDKKWDELENGEDIIIADVERTIVFDLRNCHQISGGCSLVLAGDTVYIPHQAVIEEVNKIRNARRQLELNAIQKMKNALADMDKEGSIIEIDRSR